MSATHPPYLRVVGEIRGRIGSGELRPGDRVPSAREITRQWSVAIATATKVLATLRAEGLTEAVPGVGTVVASPTAAHRPAPPPGGAVPAGGGREGAPAREAEPGLSRDRIVRAAIDIADAEGMAEVSMRRIATTLGVATMSLYRHVAGKEELLVHMIDAAIGEQPLPAPLPGGCRAQLTAVARLEWAGFRRHPWLAPVMSLTRPQLAPNAMALGDHVLRALEGSRLDMQQRLYAHLTLFSYVRGVASAFEPEEQARRETGLTYDEWMQTQEETLQAMMPADSPLRRFAEQEDFDLDLDQLFEFGLSRLLDGFGPDLD